MTKKRPLFASKEEHLGKDGSCELCSVFAKNATEDSDYQRVVFFVNSDLTEK